ncbi:MAG TPA: DUF58 domain-containing protein [Bryobacteraceae bacterium]|nr:DUF58 domain-containing protein [Bryobacteraceae bacterium]
MATTLHSSAQQAGTPLRFIDPAVLAGISHLGLVAKTVVDGFVAGLHRSPDFGFSQEFAEYRAYSPGDDLRHVDWNVFARTERMYLKRYRGETNSQLTMMLDTSASMSYTSQSVSKLDYAKYLSASLAYLSNQQRDAAGIIIFDDEVKNYIAPSTRQGQFMRVAHAIEHAQTGTRTDFAKPFLHFQQFLVRRGIIVVMSDFFEQPEEVIKVMEPLRYRGNELILFHILDPQELEPKLKEPMLLVDMETDEAIEVSPEYAKHEYRAKIQAHIDALSTKARASNIDYHLLRTDRPLDEGLREYLSIRTGRM